MARPFWSGGELAYYGAIEFAYVTSSNTAAATAGNHAIFGGNWYQAVNRSLTNVSIDNAASGITNALYMGAASVSTYAIFGGGYSNSNITVLNGNSLTAIVNATNTYGNAGSVEYLSGTSLGSSYAIFGSGLEYVAAYNTSLIRTTAEGLRGIHAGSSSNTFAYTHGAMGASNQKYAIFGGGSSALSNYYMVSVDAYDISLTRTAAANLSYNHALGEAATAGDTVIFAAGAPTTAAEGYNSSLTKITVPNLTYGRNQYAAASNGEYALFSGGYISGYDNSVDVYDASFTKQFLTMSQGRANHAGATIDDYTIFAGHAEGADVYTVK